MISGVGGETIAGILNDAPWTRKQGVSLILQPQSKAGELCRWFRGNGYVIRGAKLTIDNDRFYVVMLVRGGEANSALEPEIELLARLMYDRDRLFPGYIDDLIFKTQKALEGMKKSGAPELLETALLLSVYVGLKEANERFTE